MPSDFRQDYDFQKNLCNSLVIKAQFPWHYYCCYLLRSKKYEQNQTASSRGTESCESCSRKPGRQIKEILADPGISLGFRVFFILAEIKFKVVNPLDCDERRNVQEYNQLRSL